jgi:CRISPR-associated protein Cas2
MSARARQAFLAAYERRMLAVFTHEPAARRVSYRVGICLQAKAVARATPPPVAGTMRYVVTYDIADDRRREDVATVLSGFGPRVQLSVFECDVRTRREAAELQSTLRELVDPVEDQVRLYPLDERAARRVAMVGARVVEERQDFWIVT